MRRDSSPVLVCFAVSLSLIAPAAARAAVVFHQLDDFQTGTTMNWGQGTNATMPTTWVGSGGPTGAGDAYIENDASGTFGGSSKQVMFNQSQWAGNYLAAGINRITMDLRNVGTTPLSMRVTLRGATSAAYSTTNPLNLPADGQWHHAVFDLDSAGMSPVPFTGSGTLDDTLANVFEMRILSASGGPSITGDAIQSAVDVDNVFATQAPEPGAVLAVASLGIMLGSRRRGRSSNHGTPGGIGRQKPVQNLGVARASSPC